MAHRRVQKQKAKLEREAKKAETRDTLNRILKSHRHPSKKKFGQQSLRWLADPTPSIRKMIREDKF